MKGRIQIESLQIVIPADSRSVSLVRAAVAEIALRAGMSDSSIDDARTIVTEACMNAAVHAYPDGGGTIAVKASADDREMTIEVRDHGLGLRPDRKDPEGSNLRLGLALISALSSGYSISGGAANGTTVSMTMPVDGGVPDPPGPLFSNSVTNQVHLVGSTPGNLAPSVARALGGFRADDSENSGDGDIAVATSLLENVLSTLPQHMGSGEFALTLEPVRDGTQISIGPLSAEDEQTLVTLLEETAQRVTPSTDLEISRATGPTDRITFTLPD